MMKQTQKLLNDLRSSGRNVAVAQYWLDDLANNIKRCKEKACIGESYLYSRSYINMERDYENLVGFLSGLCTMSYICDDVVSDLTAELIDAVTIIDFEEEN